MNDIITELEESFSLKFELMHRCLNFQALVILNIFILARVKYVMVNQTEVAQFGLITALHRMLDKKVNFPFFCFTIYPFYRK